MLEAQVEEDPLLSRTRTDPDWHRDSRYDLQSSIQVVSPAHSRTYQQALRPLSLLRTYHLVAAGPQRLQQKVQPRFRQPDDGLAEIHTQGFSRIVIFIERAGNPGGADVPMRHPVRRVLDADRQVSLKTCSAGTAAVEVVSGGKQDRQF